MGFRRMPVASKIALCLGAVGLVPLALVAQATATSHFAMAAQPLGTALHEVARITGAEIMFTPESVSGLEAPSLQGDWSAEQAADKLIAGSGLVVEAKRGGSVLIVRSNRKASAGDAAAPGAANEILVTGTRIRGATVASPEIILSRDEMIRAGQSNLGDAVRSLPQNFGGGQNPTVATGAGGAPDNINVGSGSTINLRGIGQDATLTLLNGHRVAYNAAYQGIDVSSIPLAAVDRMDVITDGSSALYGSDAVGGVANIILRRDFDGLWTSARLGTATDGGDFQQQYSAVGGSHWGDGGFIATYDFGRDTAITASQRPYTDTLNPASTLLPYQKHHSVLLSAHQDVLPALEFSIDGTFNDRWSHATTPINSTGSYLAYGLVSYNHSISYSVAPTLKYRLENGWRANLLGVYGNDKTFYGSDVYYNGSDISPTKGCYCNTFENVELSAEGPLIKLPGGEARLALGGGYRNNGFHGYRTIGAAQDIDVSQGVYYGYGEVYLPIVSDAQDIPAISALSLDGAFRYEDYKGIDQQVTPKFGLVYSPTPGLQLKGTWGKSFRAPTLYEQYSVQYSYLYTASAVGGVGYPATSTALLLSGANPDLKSERATGWTVTAVIAPPAWQGFHAEIGYYHIDYRDRVVTPISSRSASLSNPAYADLVDTMPSAGDVATVANAPYSFNNLAGVALDPANVVAIIDNRYRNIARQIIQGVDASVRYHLKTQAAGDFTLTGNLTYLNSRQRLGPDLADLAVAGTIFYPPHVRGRAGLLWDKGPVSLSSFVNYIGGVRDNRQSPSVRVGSMTMLDVSGQYRFGHDVRLLAGSEILIAIQNLNNAKPDRIMTTASYYAPYDSTNYSAVGRTISLTFSKHW